jgi:outer membrane protein assembly factor BamB
LATAQPGTNIWTYTNNHEPILSSPAVGSDGTIYVGSYDQALHAIDSATGLRKWRFSVAPSNFTQVAYIYSTPAVAADGTIYFGTEQQNFMTGAFSGNFYAVNPDGTQKWKFAAGDPVYSDPAVDADGTIYFGCYDRHLYALEPNGQLKWRFLAGGNIFSDPSVAADGTIYFGCDDHQLYSLSTAGTLRWSIPTGAAITASPAIGLDGTIYIGSIDNNLYAIRPDGTTNWVFQTGANVNSSAAIGRDGTIYFGSDDQRLYAMRSDGTEKWRYTAPAAIRSSPAIAGDGTIYFGAEDGLVYAIDSNGGFMWSFSTGDYVFASPAIGTNGAIHVASADGYVYALSGTVGLAVSDWPMFRHDVSHTARQVLIGNLRPSISPIANRIIYMGETLSFNVLASDPDVPPDTLTYELAAGPAGASIDSVSGLFAWTPTSSAIGSTNLITVTVTDDGSPNLSSSASFTLIVVEPPLIDSILSTEAGVELTWVAIPGRSYRVQWKLNLEDSVWNDLSGDVQAQSGVATKVDNSAAGQARFYRVQALP